MARASSVQPGQRFGRLVAVSEIGRKRGSRLWLCRCDCGGESEVVAGALVSGGSQSCGCKRTEACSRRLRTHGRSGTPCHNVWKTMVQRCTNPNDAKWDDYGGRGITVCERWQSFENFYADMGDPPPGHSIERRDNNGSYEPLNCYWATRKQQANNKRSNTFLEFDGLRLTVSQWGEKLGVRPNLLSARLYRGWSVERTLTENLSGRDSTRGAGPDVRRDG